MPKQATTQSDAVKNRSRSPLMLLIAAGVGVGLLIILLSLLLWRTPRPDIARTDISPLQAAASSAQVDPNVIQSPASLLPSSAASAGVGVAATQIVESLFTPQTFSFEQSGAQSVAWGDYDNDGDLDLAYGSGSGSHIYGNDNGKLTSKTIWDSSEGGNTRSLVWGDYDNDGDLDLAVGNGCHDDLDDVVINKCSPHRSRIYRNDGNGKLMNTAVWSTTFTDITKSIAWGDYDGDRDLDLFVGNLGQDRIYRNDRRSEDGSTPIFTLAWTSTFTDDTLSIALGDYDQDGDLDLAVGNGAKNQSSGQENHENEPDRLYRNNCRAEDGLFQVDCSQNNDLAFSPVWTQTDHIAYTTSIAWGDYDGDGRLDLAIGNKPLNPAALPTLLYHNVYTKTSEDPPLKFEQFVGLSTTITSVAWGDYDGDDDLDLAIGNWATPTQIYENVEGVAEDRVTLQRKFVEQWHSLEASPDRTNSIAWGDYDNDGDLDLAVGNEAISRLYRNNQGLLTTSGYWQSSEPSNARRYTNSIAWGDYDNDGWLDLAVGNGCNYDWKEDRDRILKYCSPNQIYHYAGLDSQDIPTFTTSTWIPTESDFTTSIAWGDVNRDGWLDLAEGNDCSRLQTSKDECRSIRVYYNINGKLQTTATYSSVITDNTLSIAWGDVDGDGWLDLAVGNGCDSGADSGTQNCSKRHNRLYRNISGTLEISPAWTSAEAEDTFSIAWGDYDNDGDLDLMTGNQNNISNRLYRNERGMLLTQGITLTNDSSVSVAWGDYDGDGDLDLATGNYYRPNHVYRNEGSLEADGITPKFTEVWSSFEIDLTSNVAWGDYDNDGDLDLLIGSWGGGNRVYRNDSGSLTPNAMWTSISDPTFSVAWGDYDNDGDLDLATGQGWIHAFNETERDIRIFRNTRDAISSTAFLPSRVTPLPLIYITRPTPPDNANFYSSPQIWSGSVTFNYTLTHPSSFTVSHIAGEYSLNGEGKWQPAVPTNTRTISLTTSPGGAVHTYTWDVLNSGVLGQSDNVVFRLVAIPAISNTVNAIPGPYLYGSYAAQTFPFRVRGSQVQVYSGTVALGNEVAGALVYRLPAGSPTGIFEPYTDLTGQPFRTDNQGYLQGRGAIAPGDQLVALLPITWTDHYTVYYTSAAPTPDGINTNPVPSQLGVQNLVVSAANPLILFNLDISLEWDARNDAAFLRQLERDLNRASQILYDLSNGQMALGKVRVFQAKENWLFADVLIYASNRVRPNADLGGIVNVAGDDELAKNQGILASAYLPGQVRIGPTWTRFGNASDSLGDDWPRALAHELGHYLLYLQDNYLGVEDDFLVDADCQGSAMTDPYRVDYSEFLTRSTAWQETCANTVTARTTGRPDWETIAKFYRWLDPNKANEGPNTLPLHLTKVDFSEPASGRLPRTLAAPFFGLLDENGQPLQSRQIEGYLIKSRLITGLIEGVPVSDVITYVTAVGSADPGLIHARGAEPEDRLCVFDYSVSPMRLGCQKVGQAEATVRLHRVEDWPPQITVTPVDSQTFIITATTKLTVSPALSVQIFSDYGPPSFVKPMQPVVSTDPQVTSAEIITFTETLTTAQPTFSGFVWLSQPGSGGEPEREILVEFALGGDWPGPSIPGYIRGPGGFGGRYYGRPFVWRRVPPRLAWFRPYAPINSGDGQVTIVNIENPLAGNERYSLQTLATPPNLPLWLTPVGQAYRFSTEQTATVQNSISFQYLEQDVPAKQEDALRIYHSPDEGQTWCRLETKVFSYRNRASAKMPNNYKLCNDDLGNGEGIYVLVSTVEIPTFSQGWNNFGYTVPISRSVITALASIDGQYTSIYHYNANTKLWKLFDPTIPSEFDNLLRVNDLTDLEFGQGYWINIVTQTTLYLAVAEAGRLDVKTQEDLQALIAAAQAENIPIPPALYYGLISTTLSVNTDTKIIARVGGQDCGEATLTKTPVNQWIYKLQVKSADELTPCGAPDRTIKFEIDGQELAHDQLWNNGQAHALDLSRLRGAPPTPTSTPTSPSPVTPTPPTPITPTPTPTSPSPTTPPPTICSNNLLINSTMDRDEGWALDLGAVPAQYVSDPRGSGRSLFVGLPYNRRWGYRLWSSARQTVTIPAGQSVTLALKYLLNIEPRSGWDDQFIAILDRYNRVSKLWNISRSDNGQWRDFSQDISEYAGQTVQVYAGVTNDGFEGVTSMLVDDVSLCIR